MEIMMEMIIHDHHGDHHGDQMRDLLISQILWKLSRHLRRYASYGSGRGAVYLSINFIGSVSFYSSNIMIYRDISNALNALEWCTITKTSRGSSIAEQAEAKHQQQKQGQQANKQQKRRKQQQQKQHQGQQQGQQQGEQRLRHQ